MAIRVLQFIFGGDLVRRVGGAILDKELRVASRRRWSYVLRFAYLALLTGFVAVAWAAATASPMTPAGTLAMSQGQSYVASRMAGFCQEVVAAIVWFQFVAAQVLAATMLSTAVSGEIRRRTLVTLLATPVSGFKILIGKLVGCQLQIVLLVATSLPLLALVRVFGGVPWDFVAAGVCLTVAGAIFTGAVSLYFSVSSRQAWSAILKTAAIVVPVFVLLPLAFLSSVTVVVGRAAFSDGVATLVLPFAGPATGMEFITANLFLPSGSRSAAPWPLTCLVTLATAGCVLALAARRLRAACFAIPVETALEAVVNHPHTAHGRTYASAHQTIRRIQGSPIVWRETHLAGSVPLELRQIAKGFALVTLVFATGFGLAFDAQGIVFLLLGLATAVTAYLASSSITREKEAGAWSSLLMTPLSDWDVVFGKLVGTLRRTWFLWVVPPIQMAGFSVFSSAGAGVFLYALFLAAGMAVLAGGAGVYFSVRFRRTTSAFGWTLGLVAAWLLGASVLDLVGVALWPAAESFLGRHMLFFGLNPDQHWGPWSYLWPPDRLPVPVALAMGLLFLGWNAGMGLFMAWRAAARVRRNVF